MKYSTFRLLELILMLAYLAVAWIVKYTGILERTAVLIALLVAFALVVVMGAVADEKYPQYHKDQNNYMKLFLKFGIAIIILVCVLSYHFGMFPVAPEIVTIIMILGFEIFIYFKARRIEKNEGSEKEPKQNGL